MILSCKDAGTLGSCFPFSFPVQGFVNKPAVSDSEWEGEVNTDNRVGTLPGE